MLSMDGPDQVLSVSTRRLWCRLIGHNHLIVGAAMVHFVDARQGRQTRTITGDTMGEFFIWDIGNGQVKTERMSGKSLRRHCFGYRFVIHIHALKNYGRCRQTRHFSSSSGVVWRMIFHVDAPAGWIAYRTQLVQAGSDYPFHSIRVIWVSVPHFFSHLPTVALEAPIAELHHSTNENVEAFLSSMMHLRSEADCTGGRW